MAAKAKLIANSKNGPRRIPPASASRITQPARSNIEFPSGDSIDVVFENRREVVAVEVKAAASSEADLARGLFQCLKYRHVLEAQGRIEGWHKRVRALLAIEGALAPVHLSLKAALGVDVVEKVQRTRSRPGQR